MKTSELTGPKLDYWVARAEGRDYRLAQHICQSGFIPSIDWAHGGPIIEREWIDLDTPEEDERGRPDAWSAIVCAPPRNHQWMFGPTALIAAMRAYVASKFGEEVPDEVTA